MPRARQRSAGSWPPPDAFTNRLPRDDSNLSYIGRLRNGKEYRSVTRLGPEVVLMTNYRFEDFLEKAVKMDRLLGDVDEGLADGAPSLCSLSPLSTPPTSQQPSPTLQAVPVTGPDPPPFQIDAPEATSASPDRPTSPTPSTTSTLTEASRVDSDPAEPAATSSMRLEPGAPKAKGGRRRGRRVKKKSENQHALWKARLEKHRHEKRAREDDSDGVEGPPHRKRGAAFARHHADPAALPYPQCPTSSPLKFRIARGAYLGRREKRSSTKPWTKSELVQRGFRVFKWDGRYAHPSDLLTKSQLALQDGLRFTG